MLPTAALRRGILCVVLLLVLSIATPARANTPLTWRHCTLHLDWPTASHVVRRVCARYPIRRAHTRVTGETYRIQYVSPHVRVKVVYPTFALPTPERTAARPSELRDTVLSGNYTALMLVTYYVDSGPMADGVQTYWGAAACGYDLPLEARVSVPGVGLLVCHDRIGFQPYRHVDVWGVHPGVSSDYRLVTVYL